MKKLSSTAGEFKKFIMRGNVVDMAVGVIIGGAFGKIVTSLVNDMLMPWIGYLMGDVNFTDLAYEIKPAVAEVVNEAGEIITPAKDAILFKYGNFIQTIIDFLLIALCIFLFVKVVAGIRARTEAKERAEEEAKKAAEAAAAAAAPKAPTQEELLTEIRDLLKAGK